VNTRDDEMQEEAEALASGLVNAALPGASLSQWRRQQDCLSRAGRPELELTCDVLARYAADAVTRLAALRGEDPVDVWDRIENERPETALTLAAAVNELCGEQPQ
jgi:hypothetical protein